ncbi:Putative PKHD-type hydroxylase TPA1 [[Torrubiella] hemipterigena]|uniref:uS12 prolyl 3,4-dihydroxylase n=1 Tax=[Torrubiella] hemipterigena TaxID=1531966 RepID=A0A0A1SZP9_9HYPO|nr:Putative PKHD-type hydroxylase TPA1 [[Torrubiella] hemipterigena]
MKRKAETQPAGKAINGKKAKTSLPTEEAQKRFRDGLFDKKVLDEYTTEYATSSPYKHAVIHELVSDKLLRSVRDEVQANVQFTRKETDIYKIDQSGDLANLDGLDDESLAKLPSLLSLRDAIYSETFRKYIADITGCGPLSGRKTDMAINVYTPGCYLLCHDDVIGSRRVSYILYLTDPDQPWQAEWGGSLRLFPVEEIKNKDGEVARTPLPDPVKVIPPAWNQLSFFAVQPGESFHDVEEVYHANTKEQLAENGGRVRMAISGWFHIPQPGEDGFVQGEEEKNAKNSSLMQLQGNPAQYDAPQAVPVKVTRPKNAEEAFEESDLDYLIKYMTPSYLTPDTLEQISEHFENTSSISLPQILSKKFSERLENYIREQEKAGLPKNSKEIEKSTQWKVAKPPHKHAYLYQNPTKADELRTSQEESPITELIDNFLPSRPFRNWLTMATGCTIEAHDIIARRFRRGNDYTLATGHEGNARLELNLGITPTYGWGDPDEVDETAEDEDEDDDDDEEPEEDPKGKGKGKAKAIPKEKPGKKKKSVSESADKEDAEDVGGHEVYMAGDDEADEDAAVYKSSNDEDNILFHQSTAWNKLTLVLRDAGILKFVKYVSRKAPGDRWDISGVYDIEDEDNEEGGASLGNGESSSRGVLDESEEEEFNGFSASEDSDSD